MQKDNLRKLIIPSTLTIGNNVIIAGGQFMPGVGSLRIWQVELEVNGAQTITPYTSTTNVAANVVLGTNAIQIPGAIVLTATGSAAVLQATGTPWMETLPGQALVWNLSTAATITGALWYSLA